MDLPDYIKNRYWKDFLPAGVTTEIEIPEDLTLIDIFQSAAINFGDKVAFDYYGNEYTFNDINVNARRFSRGMLKLGLKKGDVVALWLPNCPHFMYAYFGSMAVGATLTAISPLFVKREMSYQVKDSGAKYLVVIDRFLKQYYKAEKELDLRNVIVVNIEGQVPDVEETDKIIRFNTFMEQNPEPLRDDEFDIQIDTKKDLAVIQYTGGTTGLPKGAELSHYNVVAMSLQIKQVSDYIKNEYLKEDIVTISILPWYHIYGQICELVANCIAGGKGYLLATFDIPKIAEIIKNHRPNMLMGVPTMFINLLNSPHFENLDLSCIKYALVGAGALPQEIAKEWERRSGSPMGEGYGLSETSTGFTAAPPWSKRKLGSCGHPMAGILMGIIDENLNFLPIGEPGEVVVSGPNVMVGYHNRPEENKLVFFEAGGHRWLRTGDFGKLDEEGYLFLLDRMKDLIKYKGHSVYPREIEGILHEHPAILECSVIGVKDEIADETIKAYIILQGDYKGKITEQEIIEWSKENMAAYKYPRIVKFVRSLPKSAVGKVLRRVLREKEAKKAEKRRNN